MFFLQPIAEEIYYLVPALYLKWLLLQKDVALLLYSGFLLLSLLVYDSQPQVCWSVPLDLQCIPSFVFLFLLLWVYYFSFFSSGFSFTFGKSFKIYKIYLIRLLLLNFLQFLYRYLRLLDLNYFIVNLDFWLSFDNFPTLLNFWND